MDDMSSQYSPEQMRQLMQALALSSQMQQGQGELQNINALQQGQHHSFLGGVLPGVAAGLGGQKQNMTRQDILAKILGGGGGAGGAAGAGLFDTELGGSMAAMAL